MQTPLNHATSQPPAHAATEGQPLDLGCSVANVVPGYEVPVFVSPKKRPRREQPHKTLERYAELCAFLMKQPRTARELCAASDIGTRAYDGVLRFIDAMRAEGVVYIHSWRINPSGKHTAIYAWQPSVCEFEDAVAPVGGLQGRVA